MSSIILAALLAASSAPPPSPPAAAAPASAPEEERGPNDPPDGTPEDRQLWAELRASTNDAAVELSRLGQAAYRMRYGRYYETLDARIASAAGPEQERLRLARERLLEAARAADDAVPKTGLRVRPCKYVHLELQLRMDLVADPKVAAELEQIRADARRCVAELQPVVGRLRPSADALEATLAATDVALGRAVPAVPQATATDNPYLRL